MCNIIAIANQKGGAGKTTTTKNLAKGLVNEGKRVLVIDFDPQSSLSVSLGFSNTDQENNTIAELMQLAAEGKELPDAADVVRSTEEIDIILGSLSLSGVEMSIYSALDREYILDSVLEAYKSDYDVILIDCNPSLGVLVINALVAADKVIIPVDSNYLAAKGLEQFLRTVFQVRKRKNPRLEISGILFTKYTDRTNISKITLKDIAEAYGAHIKVFDTKIPNAVAVGVSDREGKSIFAFAPKSTVAKAYEKLVQEVIAL